MDYQVKGFIPKGKLRVPSSKSFSHRYLIAAFISNKPVTITNINLCDDVMTSINALKTMGAVFEIEGNTVKFIKREKVIEPIILDVKESGTSLRMLFPIAIYLFDHVIFKGAKSLFSRPMGVYKDILDEQGIKYERSEDQIEVFGKLKAKEFKVVGDISSQFISGLLFLNALAGNKKWLKVIPPVESKFYIVMTLNVLEEFGYIFQNKDFDYKFIGKSRVNSSDFDTEVDYSLLANFAVLAALEGNIELYVSTINSIQGDSVILDFLSTIGAAIKYKENSIQVSHFGLTPFKVDLADCIDLGPTLFALACLIPGTTKFSGIKRLQYKESNRIQCMINELNKVGVEIEATEKSLYIVGKDKLEGDFVFETYNDHRIAMALTILGMHINGNVTIKGAECVSKSYPDFFKDLESLR